jgi:hypothetical protein
MEKTMDKDIQEYKKKWCTRCNRYHDSLPVDEKKIIQDHAMDIAREMDAEILLHLIDRQVIENLVRNNEGHNNMSKGAVVASELQKRSK